MASYIARRKFLAALLGGAAAWPPAARAQQAARRPLIVYLAGVSSASVLRSTMRRGFLNGLRDYGLVDGQNLDIVYRFAGGQFDRLPALAEASARVKLLGVVMFFPKLRAYIVRELLNNPEHSQYDAV